MDGAEKVTVDTTAPTTNLGQVPLDGQELEGGHGAQAAQDESVVQTAQPVKQPVWHGKTDPQPGFFARQHERLLWQTRFHQKLAEEGQAQIYADGVSLVVNHKVPFIRKLVMHGAFEFSMAIIILGNCIMIGWQAEIRNMDETEKTINLVLENVFTAIFTLELVLRLICFNWTMLVMRENTVDVLLVVLAVFSTWIVRALEIELEFLRKLTVLRTLRLMRLGRVVRFRPEFKEMWALLRGLMDSTETLFWTTVMLGGVVYIFGILATTLIGKKDYMKDIVVNVTSEVEIAEREVAQAIAVDYFHNVPLSMLTLFQVMTLDSWAEELMRPLSKVEPLAVVFFVVFITIGSFVFLNLITAVIVENTFLHASEEQDLFSTQLGRKKEAALEGLRSHLREIDRNEDGRISLKELLKAASKRKVRQKLRQLEVMPKDLTLTWELLDGHQGDGELEITVFTDGLRRLQGEARAKDIIRLQRESRILQDAVEDIKEIMHVSTERLSVVQDMLGRTSNDIQAFRRTMSRATQAVQQAAKTQRLSD